MDNTRLHEMLMNSTEKIHGIIMEPKKEDMETTKILIASANTLAQTVKTMVQMEVISLKLKETRGNTTRLIHDIARGE